MARDVSYEGYPPFKGRSIGKVGEWPNVYCRRRIEIPKARQRFPAKNLGPFIARATDGFQWFACMTHVSAVDVLISFRVFIVGIVSHIACYSTHQPQVTPPERIGRSDRTLRLSTNSSLYSVFYASCYVQSLKVYANLVRGYSAVYFFNYFTIDTMPFKRTQTRPRNLNSCPVSFVTVKKKTKKDWVVGDFASVLPVYSPIDSPYYKLREQWNSNGIFSELSSVFHFRSFATVHMYGFMTGWVGGPPRTRRFRGKAL